MTRRLLLVLISVAALTGRATAETKPDSQSTLETAIPEGIRLLEAKDYKQFLKLFVAPEDFEKITAQTPLDDFAERFGMSKSADLLKVLKEIKGKTPEYNDDKTKATFKFELEDVSKKSITFVKVKDAWFISN